MKPDYTLSAFEDEILEVINDFDLYTTSDLQGIITVIVQKIYEYGKKEVKK